MKKEIILGLIAATVGGAAWANYEWRGATGEWSTSAANWWDGSALVPWSNGSYAEMPVAASGVETDISVDAGGVTASTYEQLSGATYSLSGGPLAVSTFSVHPGLLTVNNAVSASGTFYVKGKVTIANGGSLVVSKYESAETAATGTDTAVVTVLAGGTLEVTNFTAVGSKYSTLYVDGGTVKHALTRYQDHVAFSNSKIKAGPNGMHVGEARAGQMSFLPYPVASGGDTDGGVWVEPHSGYYLLYGSNTYKGGLHLMPGGGQVGIQSDGNLGATTSAPTNSIICEGDGTTKTSPVIVSHSQGAVTLGANRDMLIGDNAMLRLSTYSASSRLVLRGAIDCVNRENGVLKIGDYSTGAVVLETTGGRTNHLGRLFVTQPLIIGGGTTLLENTTKLARGTGGNDENWSINDGSPLHISGSGHLMVTGGVLKVLGSRSVCISANMTVSDGGFVDLTGREVLYSYQAPATTTIRNGGKLAVWRMRNAGDNGAYYTDATKSVINVETGGVLRVTEKLHVTAEEPILKGRAAINQCPETGFRSMSRKAGWSFRTTRRSISVRPSGREPSRTADSRSGARARWLSGTRPTRSTARFGSCRAISPRSAACGMRSTRTVRSASTRAAASARTRPTTRLPASKAVDRSRRITTITSRCGRPSRRAWERIRSAR